MTTEKRKKSCLKLIHQNINRFSGKIPDIELLIDKHSPHILCFSETWLKPTKMSFNINTFSIASLFNRTISEGGGTIILCKSNIQFKERKDITSCSIERHCEIACAELEDIIILCVYKPPTANFDLFTTCLENALVKLSRSSKTSLVCGDFNIDLLKESKEKLILISLLGSFNLCSLFMAPTRITTSSATCIDNVFTNCPIREKEIISGVRSDHTAQLVDIIHEVKNIETKIEYRPITKNRQKLFKNKIKEKLLELNLPSNNVNSTYKTLFDTVSNQYNKVFTKQIKTVTSKLNFSDWATKGIRISRDRMYELYLKRTYDKSEKFDRFVKKYSKIFKFVCICAKQIYISNKIKKADNKIKATWSIVNNATGKVKNKYNDSIYLNVGGHVTSHSVSVANTFESTFASIPIETTKNLISSPDDAEFLLKDSLEIVAPNFKFEHITYKDIVKSFNLINVKKSEDLWGMSVKAIKSIIYEIAPILAHIFNISIDEGVFPDLMKLSKVVPIYKSGCKYDPTNYRPVSILPVLSKIFEKVLLTQLSAHFNINGFLHKQQFGFTKGRSTTHAGADLIQNILEAWEKSQNAIGIFCDLSKAFDCVNHEILVRKLKYYGVTDEALKLISSYLTDREMRVYVNKGTSVGTKVKLGVPQGSILGPFLFLVYINDLPNIVKELADIVLFADDTSLVFKVNRKTCDLGNLNKALTKLSQWFSVNNLALNSKKTKCVYFASSNFRGERNVEIFLNNEKLEIVDEALFLGLTIDSSLQWGPHINILSSRLSSAVFAIRKIRQLTDVQTAKIVYFAYFQSLMSYGILLWGSAADWKTIFILQKRAIRAIYKMKPRDSLRHLFKDIGILTMPSLYIFENIMYIRKHLPSYKKNSDSHHYNTRNKHKLSGHKYRLSKTTKSFMGSSIRFYNMIPKDITDLSDRQFKSKIKEILIKKSYYKINDYIDDKNAWKM